MAIKAKDKFGLCGDIFSNNAAENIRSIFTTVELRILSGLRTKYPIIRDDINIEDLDHFNLYNANPSENIRTSLRSDLSVELHVDKGLFVLITAAEGLVIRRKTDNRLYHVGIRDTDQLFLMLGEGLSALSYDYGSQLKDLEDIRAYATVHGVRKISPGTPRVSIARMILPSKNSTNFWMNFHATSEASDMQRRNLKACAAGEVYCWYVTHAYLPMYTQPTIVSHVYSLILSQDAMHGIRL